MLSGGACCIIQFVLGRAFCGSGIRNKHKAEGNMLSQNVQWLWNRPAILSLIPHLSFKLQHVYQRPTFLMKHFVDTRHMMLRKSGATACQIS